MTSLSEVKYPMIQMNANCTLCPELVKSRNRITWGFGNIHSLVVFVGEAPGMYGCDITGIPFTKDKSGEYFQSILNLVGWKKEDVYVTNIVKCCPQGNREPEVTEVDNCSIFIQYELQKIKPTYVVVMGKPAMKSLLGLNGSIISFWDKMYKQDDIRYIIIPHPAFIVRNVRRWETEYINSFKKIKEYVSQEFGT